LADADARTNHFNLSDAHALVSNKGLFTKRRICSDHDILSIFLSLLLPNYMKIKVGHRQEHDSRIHVKKSFEKVYGI
jgi:hypothetical protein